MKFIQYGEKSHVNPQLLGQFWLKMSQNQMFVTDIAPSDSHQITSFKVLTYTVFYVLFSHVHGFEKKKII